MILYADSSFILSIHLKEPSRHEIARRVVDAADGVACSLIALPEVRSGLARAHFRENPPRLTDASYARAVEEFQHDWRRYFRILLTDELILRAGQLAEAHRIRGYDAVHLASCLTLKDLRPDQVVVATWDKELADASISEGLSLAHEVN